MPEPHPHRFIQLITRQRDCTDGTVAHELLGLTASGDVFLWCDPWLHEDGIVPGGWEPACNPLPATWLEHGG